MAGVLAVPVVMKARFRDFAQAKRIIKFTIGEQAGIGGHGRAMELKTQTAIEIHS